MPEQRSIIAARERAIRSIAKALKRPGTLALVGNLSGDITVTGRPTCIYARLARQPSKVIVAQIGATPPSGLAGLRNWLIEIKQITEEGTVRYRVTNWLEDALGRPATQATYDPANHIIDPALGPHTGSLDNYYHTETEIGGTGGAALVGIEDAGGLFTATDVEAALQEVMAAGGARAYRYPFTSLSEILFSNPFSVRPAVTVHFDTTLGFGIQRFGTSPFGGRDYWTQEGPLATAIESITFPTGQVRVVLAAAATGEVLCHA